MTILLKKENSFHHCSVGYGSVESGGNMTRDAQRLVVASTEETRLNLSEPIDRIKQKKTVIVLERHTFTRGCLCSWIQTFCKEFQLTHFPDVSSPLLPPALANAALIIVRAATAAQDGGWLAQDVSCLRMLRPNLPIIAIIDDSQPSAMTEAALRLGLEGYIPITSTLEIAAAVLHLVAAGGTYVPHLPDHSEAPALPAPVNGNAAAANEAGLTPRERKVLDLLAQGMSNKTIAYSLSLSESTVKVHVHRIISKFKVHNRTEAVVCAYHLRGNPPHGRTRVLAAGARMSAFPAVSEAGAQIAAELVSLDRTV